MGKNSMPFTEWKHQGREEYEDLMPLKSDTTFHIHLTHSLSTQDKRINDPTIAKVYRTCHLKFPT